MKYLSYHRTLNPKLFDGDILRPEVIEAMLRVADAWIEFAHIPIELVKDVIFTGGNANYNYTRWSDIDIHIILNKKHLTGFDDLDMINDYLGDKKTLWTSSRNIKIRGYSVEMYAQDISDHLVASGVYSLKHNEWITRPIHGKYNFNRDPILNKKIDEMIDVIDKMISDHRSQSEFEIMKEKIKDMRKAAMESGNEFSFENLVFKGLRNSGVLDRMNDYLKNIVDKSLTLEKKVLDNRYERV